MKKISLFIVLLISFISIGLILDENRVYADELTDTINEQLENLDLSEMEKLSNNLENTDNNSFMDNFYNMLNGRYNVNNLNIIEYLKNVFLENFNNYLPIVFTIIAICVFCSIIQSAKSIFASEGVSNIIFLVCFLSVILLLSTEVLSIWNDAKKTLENIAKINEIMSPIMITLMIASGSSISASIYKPSVAIFSNVVINIIYGVVLPLIGLMIIFGILSHFSKNLKFEKFVDFFAGLIKWIIGIVVACYSLYISVQGFSGAIHDGISIKAAKYAISNTIPLVGGFLRDGFDLFVAGSVLIKNTIGLAGLIMLFTYVMIPVLKIAVFCLILKLAAAVTESISDSKISELCVFVSKGLSYINMALILSGFMMFISILLMIFSANAFF